MGKPLARRNDPTLHGPPLHPGPGSPNVFIEHQPVWRAVPLATGQALLAAHRAEDTTIGIAQGGTDAAAGTPGLPLAQGAEVAAETTAAEAMASAIETAARGCGADLHVCETIYTVTPPNPIHPPGPPHGVGVVIDGSQTILINGLPAARVGDHILEAIGPLNVILQGSSTVVGND